MKKYRRSDNSPMSYIEKVVNDPDHMNRPAWDLFDDEFLRFLKTVERDLILRCIQAGLREGAKNGDENPEYSWDYYYEKFEL